MSLYEGMFVIDNDAVRAGWAGAKSAVTSLIQKHGGAVRTARRWGERRLAYPIRKRNRATFLLAYFEMEGGSITPFLRDAEISDTILRHLMLRTEAVPAEEVQLTEAESAGDFVVPEPPADDVLDKPLKYADDDDDDDDRPPRRAPRSSDDSDGSDDSGGKAPVRPRPPARRAESEGEEATAVAAAETRDGTKED